MWCISKNVAFLGHLIIDWLSETQFGSGQNSPTGVTLRFPNISLVFRNTISTTSGCCGSLENVAPVFTLAETRV